uniref:START domain-containing protein n=1 Tax=Heterorhabditis bacteriophora TaxID=37862 RepID=A0A1I7XSH7_HETBA
MMSGPHHSGSFSVAMRVDIVVPQASVHITLSSSALASWQIVRTSTVDDMQALNKVLLDLGETISVASTKMWTSSDNSYTDKQDNYFSLIPAKREAVWRKCGLRRPLFVFRQSISVEKIIDHVVEKRLRTDWQFRGAIYRGLVDYESDVSYIQSGICRLIVLCVCEIQLLLVNNAWRNDFFLFRFECDWKLNTGLVSCSSCTVLKKINHQEAYKPHMWYPYSRFPVEESDATYFIHNYPMFTGKNLDRLGTPSGGMELICDEFTNNSES